MDCASSCGAGYCNLGIARDTKFCWRLSKGYARGTDKTSAGDRHRCTTSVRSTSWTNICDRWYRQRFLSWWSTIPDNCRCIVVLIDERKTIVLARNRGDLHTLLCL